MRKGDSKVQRICGHDLWMAPYSIWSSQTTRLLPSYKQYGEKETSAFRYITKTEANSHPWGSAHLSHLESWSLRDIRFEFGRCSCYDGGESSYHFDLQSCIKLGAKTRVVLPHFSDAGRIFLLYDVWLRSRPLLFHGEFQIYLLNWFSVLMQRARAVIYRAALNLG